MNAFGARVRVPPIGLLIRPADPEWPGPHPVRAIGRVISAGEAIGDAGPVFRPPSRSSFQGAGRDGARRRRPPQRTAVLALRVERPVVS